LNTPGQNALYTFTGTTGQRVSLKVGANAPTGTVSLVNPSGGALGSANSGVSASFMEPKTLTAAGTHTIKVDPGAYNTGSTTVAAYDVPADSAGTISVGGASVGVSLGTAGQNGTLTFSGTSGQQVTVRLTSNTFGLVTVKLLKPDGNQLTSSASSAGSFNLAQQTLPTTGTYTVVIDPSIWNTGSITVSVTNP
ncbi:MAG: IPT/TIG domain-containing protein, partial [Vicinamibacterales bacterium]